MPYIIKISDYETTQYVERMNGRSSPTLTEDISHAKEYSEDTAKEYLDKVKVLLSRQKNRETVTIELIPVKATVVPTEPKSAAPPSASTKTHSPLYIKGLGEPRGQFVFGGVAVLNLYMTKDKDGKIIYAFTSPEGEIQAYKYDGPAVMCAFCEEAEAYGVEKIRAYEERHNG